MAIAKRNYTDAEAEAVAAANSVPITRIIGAASPITVTPADGELDEDLEIGISSATTDDEGAVELATVSETKDGTDTDRAVTAAGVAGIVSLDTPATDGGIVKAGAGVLTLTAAANRSVTFPITAAQTDAITTTADGDTNASTILQSGANGDLRLDRLGVGVAVIAASGTIALPDAGYIGNGAATARLGFDSSGATDVAYFSGCNVGIGTEPDATLHVDGTGIRISGSGAELRIMDRGGSGNDWQTYVTGDDLRFYDGSDRVAFESGGNVVIGDTTQTDGLLDVNGDINTREQYLVDGTQVVTNRQTGWGAPTGTATRTSFATGSVTLEDLAERVHALIDDLMTHGLIGA